jgi:tetratricopeptide (TPR) repeat protein
MSLVDPGNAGIHLEIARTCTDKGSRLATLHQAVDSWYAAETWFIKACELDPANPVAIYELGEVLYVLGRYQQAAELWQSIAPGVEITGQRKLESRIAAILAGRVPRVPPVDYLTALAVAVEEHQAGHNDQAVAIIEDVLADAVFEEQFPLQEIYYLLGTCYQEMGLLKESAEAFTRS